MGGVLQNLNRCEGRDEDAGRVVLHALHILRAGTKRAPTRQSTWEILSSPTRHRRWSWIPPTSLGFWRDVLANCLNQSPHHYQTQRGTLPKEPIVLSVVGDQYRRCPLLSPYELSPQG